MEMRPSEDLPNSHSGSDVSDIEADEKPDKTSSLLEDRPKHDFGSSDSDSEFEDIITLKDEEITEPTSNKWSLRLKLFSIVILSVILVAVVTMNKLRTMHSQSSSTIVGFQHSGSQRSTMDIIYSCISTTIICTISVMHFNVSRSTAHRLSFWKKIRSDDFWTEIFRKFSYWSIGLLMPELLVIMSCREYYEALEDFTIMQKEVPGWTLQLSYFALMKGFTLTNGDRIDSGLDLYKRGATLNRRLCDKYSFEISDKSKANILTKLIAITQITRFLLEEIDRAANGLPISPLEYFTCAQVFAALFTYVYWLDKPHGVQEKIRVRKGPRRKISSEFQNTKRSRMFLVGGHAALLIAASALSSWNVPFSNNGLRTLWKVASIVSAVCPVFAIYSSWLEDICNPSDEMGDTFAMFLGIIFFLHCVFRALLIALIFYSFRNMPLEIYETRSWLDFVPFFH